MTPGSFATTAPPDVMARPTLLLLDEPSMGIAPDEILMGGDVPVAVTGVSNLRIYAAMRGETPEDFLETRNAPGAFYSVAAKPKAE